jgi:hypothetical protein
MLASIAAAYSCRESLATRSLDQLHERWLAVEHHRLTSVEDWPDGPRKQIAIVAICSTLVSLSRLSKVA